MGRLLAGEAAARGYEVAALTHAELDITDPAAVAGRVRTGDLVVNCAAFTNVDAAESDPEGAWAINATGPGIVARVCAQAGADLIHLSTDYVFSGRSGDPGPPHPYDIDDPTGPLGVYGKSKLAGEQAVLAALPTAHVVRTSWVYTGAEGGDFVAVMRRLAAGDGPIEVVADQIGSPTYAVDLVAALLQVAAGGIRPGILHAANDGAVSRFDQARAVFAGVGADPDRVRPVSTAASGRPAPRPAFSALSMAGSARAGLSPLRPWREALTASLQRGADGGPIPSTA